MRKITRLFLNMQTVGHLEEYLKNEDKTFGCSRNFKCI